MNDEYETFNNKDTAEDDTEQKTRRRKIDRNTLSFILLCVVSVVCVANLIFCVMTYNKYDELQLGAQFYFQNSGEPVNSSSDVIVEYANDPVIINTETTTIMHIEITTQPQSSKQNNFASPTNSHTSAAAVSTTAATSPSSSVTVASTAAAETKTSLININTATVEELTALNGIGPAKAQAIVDYRYENGYFMSTEELTDVSGIGEKTFEKIKNYVTVE